MIKRVSFWLYIVFAILLLVVAFAVNASIQKTKDLVSVVETTKNIQAYQPIQPSDLKVVQIPRLAMSPNAVTNANQLLNKYTTEFLPSNTQVSSQMVYQKATTPAEVLKKVGQSNQVMVAIPVQSNDIGNQIIAGNEIDIVDSSGKTNTVVQGTVLKVESPTLLYVLMNQSDYLSIVGNLGGLRLELPGSGA